MDIPDQKSISVMLCLIDTLSCWKEHKKSCLMGRIYLCTMSTRAPSIGQILKEGVAGQEVTVRAWVKSLRRQKVNTFLHLEDGLSHHKIQVVLSNEQVWGGYFCA